MMKNTIFTGSLLLGAAVCVMVSSCAKTVDRTDNEANREYLEAWVSSNYPGIKPDEKGVYILEDTPGTGRAYQGESFAIVSYTAMTMDGTVSNTTDKKTAQQVGSYNETAYYGPAAWYIAENSVSAGVEDVLHGMKIGSTRTALIPSWMMTYKRYSKPQEYFKHTTSYSNQIYKVSLVDITDDIDKWENDSLARYTAIHYPGLDTLTKGLYYKALKAGTDIKEMPSDTTVYINYIGRRLDGIAFDSNIADTAKKYGFFSKSTSYQPAAINWGDQFTDITMSTGGGEGSSVVNGFSRMLWEMKPYGKSVAYFTSAWGYGYSGSGSKIPSYSPILFEVELVDKPE